MRHCAANSVRVLGLSLDSALALKVLAVRATAMPAGVRNQVLCLTAVTPDQHAGGRRGSAVLHGGHGLQVTGQSSVRVLREVGACKALDEAGQCDHLTRPQSMLKRLIKASMRWQPSASVWLVRWV